MIDGIKMTAFLGLGLSGSGVGMPPALIDLGESLIRPPGRGRTAWEVGHSEPFELPR